MHTGYKEHKSSSVCIKVSYSVPAIFGIKYLKKEINSKIDLTFIFGCASKNASLDLPIMYDSY